VHVARSRKRKSIRSRLAVLGAMLRVVLIATVITFKWART
jgi:hypothetical protein